jgi:hypothetical protein
MTLIRTIASSLLLAFLTACGTAPQVSNVAPVVTVHSVDEANAHLATVAVERAAIESRFAAREQVCYEKFFVNHCLDDAVKERSKVPEASTTHDRMVRLIHHLGGAPVTSLDDAWKLLGSDDGYPRSICTNMATPEAPHGAATCGAIAMNLDTGDVWAQQGFVHNVAPEKWNLP